MYVISGESESDSGDSGGVTTTRFNQSRNKCFQSKNSKNITAEYSGSSL